MWKINDLEVPVLSQDLAQDNWHNLQYRSQTIWHMFREEFMFDALAETKPDIDCSDTYMSLVGYSTASDRFQVTFIDASSEQEIVLDMKVVTDHEDEVENVVDVRQVPKFDCDILLLRLPHPDEGFDSEDD